MNSGTTVKLYCRWKRWPYQISRSSGRSSVPNSQANVSEMSFWELNSV